jgi:hypothetical protein
MELADSFLDLAKGYDMPVGSVVVLSSVSLLARIGTAAYAEEVVRAFARIRDAYANSVRVVHGFPVLVRGLEDETIIRSMLEIELWLSDCDKRRIHSLPSTSEHFITEWLRTNKMQTDTDISTSAATDTHPHPLRLPHSLHSLEKGTFISPGWEDMATSLPTLQEEDEKKFLGILLEELNEKFALQLDLEPSTDRSSQSASDYKESNSISMILAGSSHLARTIDSIDRESINLLDATVPGFRINPLNVAKMASDVRDLVEGMDPKNTIVVIQVLDNSTYYCGKDLGEMSLPKKGKDNRYHVDGELRYVKKQLLRELFTQILDLIKAAGDCQIVLVLPLPRWLLYSCCSDLSHCTNRGDDSFSADMNQALKNIRQWLEDILTLRKLVNIHVFDPCPALGLTGPDMDVEYAMELWGTDPVHPTENGYAALAESLTNFCHETIEQARAAAEKKPSHGAAGPPPKPVRREAWIDGSQAVAQRQQANLHLRGFRKNAGGNSRGFAGRGAANPRGRGGRGGQAGNPFVWKRGFRGRGWRGGKRGH